LYEVEADAGRLEPNDSPRGESIFVTWSPKIYHEARDGAPNEVSLLMSEIIADHLKDNKTIDIYDPTSGSGSLLINIGNCVAKHISDKNSIRYFAQEIKANTYNLTRMNLIMRGINPDNIKTRNGDTLEEDWPDFDENDPIGSYKPLYLDAVVSNPPYSQQWDPSHKDSDPRYARFGLAPKTKADYAFLLHDLYHLKPSGMMTIVLPHGVLFRGGEEGKIRQALIEQDHIQAVIGLPANIFFGTGIPTTIIVLRQQRNDSDVLMVDASKHFKKEGKTNKLQASDIKRIVDVVINRQDRPKFSKLVDKQTIRDNDYNLNIPRYVDSSDDAESWDLHATLLGGIPPQEIEKLAHYWQAFPNLRATLFSQKLSQSNQNNANYAQLAINAEDLKNDALKVSISQHPEITAFIQNYQQAFAGFDDYLNTELIEHYDQVRLAMQESKLADELFKRLQAIPLIDKYTAYQLLNDQWQSIDADLEILQSEGFNASTQVDPNFVIKKVRGKDSEVQDGWKGHILPFELVQTIHLSDELSAIEQQQNRLAEISSEVEGILEALTEEEKEAEMIKDDGSAFINAAVSKAAKVYKTAKKAGGDINSTESEDSDSFEDKIIQVDALINEDKALKKALKTASDALHLKTKDTIENLSDSQVKTLLKHKWISPILDGLNALPTALINDLSQQVQTLADKYATTYADVARDIKATEQSLATMLDELTGNEADEEGLAEFKKLLLGDD